ncbi:DUF5686 and carboxypeptidase regulatory-like domain-containing protein [Flavobacterium terrisoli]|uniref:DUF5686 and carboxypeptidase regulatory-like domain-containing protein n=1 Tax=Flavobacterium terrisoli TaxID=3242195 RepID=UPI00254358D3|nr:DUF5686 and carboxypeptidase regulatory-like domain-containing protein [Flavobacterium buctense]
MVKKLLSALFLFITAISLSQVKGKVTDEKGNPLPFVNIFQENTYNGTTTNDQGKFELNIKTPGKHTVIFQYLGYKTNRQTVTIDKTPVLLDIVMSEENFILNEVVINPKDNPANEIIRKAIQNKKENSAKTGKYKADFYSRGIFRIKDAPKTILGQKFDFFDEVLDSTRSGILYLSETVSKITFQKPDKMKEVILASKVSGNDNGFSFNNAASVNFDFYENYLPFEVNVVSPIADNAFNYYKYKFEGSFFTENRQQINKIKVIPRRDTEPAMEGYIYIVDDSYSIYAVDLSIKGSQMQTPAIDKLGLKQSFSYNSNNKIWVKNTQTIDFVAGMLSIKVNGKFTYVYSNFEFEPTIEKRTFTNEILSFEENANKKEDTFWSTIRPVPLTEEETTDYVKKDVLQTKKKSKTYLDSIDTKRNKFKIMDILSGYSYRNSFKKWSIDYDGPLMSTSFNTVQGYRINAGLSYTKRNEEKRTYTRIGSRFDYGFSEEKLRATFNFSHKFNNINNSFLTINGGSSVNQFNSANPISNVVNTVSTLFFKNNFMKLYEKNFASAFFGREVINGFYMNANVEYSERKPLYNTTDFTIIKNTDSYTSNNPLNPTDETSAAIEKHNLVKANVLMRFNFGQKYWSRPDGKFNIPNDDYPALSLGYEKAMAATDKNYEYDLVMGRVTYDVTLGNKGFMQMNLKAGKFFNADNISFVDYKHFNGNLTHIGQSDSYTNVFNLLPYYSASTNDSYFETHIEHNDKGYFMNKLPLLKYLQSQLVLGFHNLAVPDRKPYQEFSVGLDNLGFGKFKFLRVDYVRSYQNGYQGDGVVFGLKFLNVLE